ncbi:MAG: hypothetical protein J7L66_02235 [Anaerolineaceae bacterium]|nr:hypothetical protein [Anaerolineaceae bacterium]
MSEEKKIGELKPILFGDKVLTVYRRCSCGGDVKIEQDPTTGKYTARCLTCGAHLEWGGKDKNKKDN